MKNIKLASVDGRDRTVVGAGGVRIGGGFTVIAGPCAVESEEQTVVTARAVKAAGADMLRGGAFKPRTSPYAFQGLGMGGLKILGTAGAETGLPVVTEVLDPRDVSWVAEYADVLQIGTRNMQNFALLKEVGLNCAEYILGEGNPDVILCERGIRTFEQYTRNTLDLSAVPALRELTHLPVIVDPTHATGRPALIGPMSRGALAVGADGIMVEVHNNPAEALCDAKQALTIERFADLMRGLRRLEGFLAEEESEGEVTG
jgi:3-deoxy-7-phosphoheptulonate synthase